MNWEIVDNKLSKEFDFSDFNDAIKFVNSVAKIAKKINHHPDILIHSYKKVKIMLFTYSENKISDQDYRMAIFIDELLILLKK